MPSLTESQRQPRLPASDMPSPPATRSQSVASDRTSAFKAPLLPSPQMSRRPEPAYIAASAASQIITNDQDPMSFELANEHDVPTSGEPALVTPASLQLVNCFLDQLLYDFLSVAGSTSLASLRPAVTEILRPTLAGEAIAGADQELHEYLGRGVEEEQLGYHGDAGPTGHWDLDAVWRQARLRCMIYSSLGDMEGEEEEMFLAEERHMDSSGYFPEVQDLVSPAVAIFLTSILEFIGEQILLLAGNAAAQRVLYKRPDAAVHDGSSAPVANGAGRLIVDELDTEKVALNPTFGRLWRAWRKRLRISVASYPRSKSRDSNVSRPRQHSIASSSRRSSIDTVEPRSGLRELSRTKNLGEVPEEDFAANIALPMSENDIEEIEVPGVADLDDYARAVADSESTETKRRPQSLTIPRVTSGEHSFPDLCRTYAPILSQMRTSKLLYLSRNRSQSLPSLMRTPFDANLEALNDESKPSKSLHHLQTPSSATTRPQDPRSEIEVKGNPSGTADVNYIHQERSEDEGQVPRRIQSEIHNGNLPVEHENQRAGTSRFRANIDSTPADTRTASPGSSLGPITEHETEHSHDAVDDGALDGGCSRSILPGTGSNELKTYGASDILDSQSGRPLDSRSVSPLDPSDTDDGLVTADLEVNPQLGDGELGTDHATIGVARTSNVPVFVAKSTSLTKSDSEPYTFESPQARSVTWSKGLDNSTHGVDSTYDLQKETGSRVQQRLSHQSHESPAVPLSPSFQADSAVARKRISPLELQQSGIAPGARASTTGNERVQSAQENSARSSLNNSQLPDSELPSSSVTVLAKQRSVGSRKSEQNHESSNSPGRASVQRVFNPPSSPREVAATSSRRPDSYGRGQRLSHSSISAAPQGSPKSNTLVPRLHDEEEMQGRAGCQPDEAGGGLMGRKHSQTAVKPSSKEKSFEQLIRSDETIQYTLTPPNMREMEETSRRRDTAEPGRPPKKTGPTFNIYPQLPDVTPSTIIPSDVKGVKPALSVSRPFRSPSKSRPGAPVARDGRAEWSSTRDFAEFIRTTGPERDPDTELEVVPSRSDSLPSKQGRSRPVGGRLRPNRSRSKKASATLQPSIPEQRSYSSRSSSLPKPKARLQARDAVVSQKDDSSDLVDFIRQGPPDQQDERDSISQVIAPFSSPSDSNPAFARVGVRARDVASTQSTVSTQNGSSKSQSQSVHSSYNSQTALLEHKAVMGEVTRSENVPPVQHKRRPVKDPYAIDSDSEDEVEEDEGIDSKPLAKSGREESLMDFLRNVPPPPAQTTLPSAFDGVPKPGSKVISKRNASSPSKSRFSRGEFSRISSSLSITKKPGPKEEKAAPSSSSVVSSQPPQLSLPSNGHDSPFDTTDALRAAARSVVGSPSSTAGNTEHRPPALGTNQPSTGRSEPARSNDIMMFLKSTGPPVTEARNPPAGKEESGFSRMFRKIKS